jgi:hypothetical protein
MATTLQKYQWARLRGGDSSWLYGPSKTILLGEFFEAPAPAPPDPPPNQSTPISVVGSSSTGYTTAYATSLIFSHTVAAGQSKVLLVEVAMFGNPTITNVTFNGVGLTKIVESITTTSWKTAMWYLLAPPEITANVEVTFSDFVIGATAGASTFANVNQTTPVRTGTESSFSTDDVSSVVPYIDVPNCLAGDFVAGVCLRNGSDLSAVDTQLWLQYNDVDNEIGCGVYIESATAGTNQLNWNMSGTQQWSVCGAAFIPASPVRTKRRVFIC